MKKLNRLVALLTVGLALFAAASPAHAWFKLFQDGVFMGIWDPFNNPEYEGAIEFSEHDAE